MTRTLAVVLCRLLLAACATREDRQWRDLQSILALEAFIIAIPIMAGCVGIIGLDWLSYSAPKGFLLESTLALAWYIGREKRDCETGLKLSAGSPKAWLLMWIRWQNLLELVGPASSMASSMASLGSAT